MFSSERDELRNTFFEAWRKHKEQLPVEPLEAQLIAVILQHPEYHPYLDHPEKFHGKDFTHENPFLHLSLHLAIREQVNTDRPAGIKLIFQTLCEKYPGELAVEHRMMECLEKILWEAQRSGVMPDEQAYLESLKHL